MKITIEVPKLPDIGNITSSLNRTAILGVQIIKERTDRGVGYMGAFAPYSAGYAKWKAKITPERTVNLQLTNEMLGAMASEAAGNTAKIYFTRKPAAEKAAWNNRTRPFFGFNQKEVSRLATYFRKELLK